MDLNIECYTRKRVEKFMYLFRWPVNGVHYIVKYPDKLKLSVSSPRNCFQMMTGICRYLIIKPIGLNFTLRFCILVIIFK